MNVHEVAPPVAVWPCCVLAVTVFLALRTQWRQGPAGPTGLDYGAPLAEVWRRLGVPHAQRGQTFADLQAMESAALQAIYEERK